MVALRHKKQPDRGEGAVFLGRLSSSLLAEQAASDDELVEQAAESGGDTEEADDVASTGVWQAWGSLRGWYCYARHTIAAIKGSKWTGHAGLDIVRARSAKGMIDGCRGSSGRYGL